jgi:hypothetical protein
MRRAIAEVGAAVVEFHGGLMAALALVEDDAVTLAEVGAAVGVGAVRMLTAQIADLAACKWPPADRPMMSAAAELDRARGAVARAAPVRRSELPAWSVGVARRELGAAVAATSDAWRHLEHAGAAVGVDVPAAPVERDREWWGRASNLRDELAEAAALVAVDMAPGPAPATEAGHRRVLETLRWAEVELLRLANMTASVLAEADGDG